MKTFKQILKEFAPSENEDDGNEHHKGYTLGPMTHLYLHNFDGVKTGHKGTITTSGGHVVSVHHNTSDQEHGDPNTQAPSDDMDEPVQGHTTIHSVLRNGKEVGHLYVTHDDYNGRQITFLHHKEGNHPRIGAEISPSLSSMREYTKHFSYDDQMNIDPENKEQLGKLTDAHRAMAEGNFRKVIGKALK